MKLKKCELFKVINMDPEILNGDCRFDHEGLVRYGKTQLVKINDSKYIIVICIAHDYHEESYNHFGNREFYKNNDIQCFMRETEEEALKVYYDASYNTIAYNYVPVYGMPSPDIYEKEEIKILQENINELGGDDFIKEIHDLLFNYELDETFYKKFDDLKKCKPFNFEDMDPETLKMDCKYDDDSFISVSKTQILKNNNNEYFVIACFNFDDTHDFKNINSHYEKHEVYDNNISYLKFSNEIEALNYYYNVSYRWFANYFVPPHGCPDSEFCNEEELEKVIDILNEEKEES